jgi:hypothetical protein
MNRRPQHPNRATLRPDLHSRQLPRFDQFVGSRSTQPQHLADITRRHQAAVFGELAKNFVKIIRSSN